jgi:hypothetical protein
MAPSRRDVLRVGGSLAGLVAVGGLAGCLDGGSGGSPRADAVPADATAVAHLDAGAMLADETLRDRVDEAVAAFSPGSEPPTVDRALASLQSQTGLDPTELDEAVVFGRTGGDGYAGILVWSDWSRESVAALAARAGFAEQSSDTTRYRSGGVDVAILGDGRYAMGTRAAVTDAIAVGTGDGAAVDGEVRTAYEAAAPGYLRFGFDVPPAQVPERGLGPAATAARDIRYGAGSFGPGDGDGEYRLAVSLELSDADSAATLAEQAEAGLTVARDRLGSVAGEREAARERAAAVVDATDVTRNGTTVTVTNSRGGELLLAALGAVVGAFVLGVGEQRGGTVSTPQAAFEFDYAADADELTITHTSGETIPAGRLLVLGNNLRRQGSWSDLGGTTYRETDRGGVVGAGDSVTVGADADYVARVVWESDGGDRSAVLALDRGPDA